MTTLQQILHTAATYGPDTVAVGNSRAALTYSEMFDRARAVCRWLSEHTPPHAGVAVVIDDNIAWMPLVVGTLLAGRVVIGCEGEDPSAPGRIWRVRPAGWLHHDHAEFGTAADNVDLEQRTSVTPGGVWFAPSVTEPRLFDADACYVAVSSGTTAAAKLIAGSRTGVAQFLQAEVDLLRDLGVGAAASTVRLAPASFDVFWRDVLVPLATGGTVWCLDRFVERRDPQMVADAVSRMQPNVLHIVPSLGRALGRLLPDWSPESLRAMLFAGESLHAADVRPWLEHTRAAPVNVYGTSETTLAKFLHRVTTTDLTRSRIPVGHCIPGSAAVTIADGRACYPGETGEVYVKTSFPLLGYLDDAGDGRGVFVANPLTGDPADLVHRTGDIGVFDDNGCLELIGRTDDMVKLRGHRVHLGQVERVIRTHPAVGDCVAVLRPAPGEGGVLLYAFVVVVDSAGSTEEILDWAGQRLSASELPQALVRIDAVPRGARGKIDRGALAQLPVTATVGPSVEDANPAATALVAAAVRAVLACDIEVRSHDSFRALGGQSIHAAQLSRRLAHQGIDIGIADILRLRTPAKIAAHARLDNTIASERSGEARMTTTAPGAAGMVSMSQARFLRLLTRRGIEHPAFRYLWAARISGPVDVDLLHRAIDAAVAEQSLSCLRIAHLDGQWRQHRATPAHEILIDPIPAGVDPTQWVIKWAEQPRDPSDSPPIHFALSTPGRSSLTVAMTGSVLWSDGFSKDALLRRISHHIHTGDPRPAPDLPSYSTYWRWESRMLSGPDSDRRLGHWRAVLPAEPQPPYPDAEDGLTRFATGEPTQTDWRTIEIAVSPAAREAAQTAGVTVTACVFWAFVDALVATGAQGPVVMFPEPNRRAPEENDTYGCLTETLLIDSARISRELPDGPLDIAASIASALDNTLPFEHLLHRLYPNIAPSHSFVEPVWFPVMFAPQPDLDVSLTVPDCDVIPIAATADLNEIPFPVMAMPIIGDTHVTLRLGIADIAGLPRIDRIGDAWASATVRALDPPPRPRSRTMANGRMP